MRLSRAMIFATLCSLLYAYPSPANFSETQREDLSTLPLRRQQAGFKITLTADKTVQSFKSDDPTDFGHRMSPHLVRRLENVPPLPPPFANSSDGSQLPRRSVDPVMVELTPEKKMYYTTVFIGDPERTRTQLVRVAVMTGPHRSWVIGPDPKVVYTDRSLPDTGHYSYNPDMSDSARKYSSCSVQNGAEIARGSFVKDNVVVLNSHGRSINSPNVVLCVADVLPPSLHSTVFAADGILGLGPPLPKTPSFDVPLLQQLRDGGALADPVVSFYMPWQFESSEIFFGGRDDSRYVGDFVDFTVPRVPGQAPMWAMELEVIRVNTVRVETNGPLMAYIEAGVNSIEVPLTVARDMFLRVDGKQEVAQPDGSVRYSVSCDSSDQVSFTFEGVRIGFKLSTILYSNVPPYLHYCYVAIVGKPNRTQVVLGHAFLSLVYTSLEFPAGRPLKIHLAELSGERRGTWE